MLSYAGISRIPQEDNWLPPYNPRLNKNDLFLSRGTFLFLAISNRDKIHSIYLTLTYERIFKN